MDIQDESGGGDGMIDESLVPAALRLGRRRARKPSSHCYELAWKFVRERPALLDLRLVHGAVAWIGPLEAGHAWVESGDIVFDPTSQSFYSHDAYYRSHRAIATYNRRDAAGLLIARRHYGPWHGEPVHGLG